ncbi:Prenylcysteine oxidase [Eremomyces bilateralis CBS 781.70]|uniref:Prenylcysteine oxidase n=1 Tax=Eremomyces bilateralis CBS 781.70 TaxID=1392243 RepID=A0A6G1FXR7_9PEZI|nr:Prenylcysteine oxidase [Eremomyces bilateralis CBS 781.70]KAF1810583.1 Prenylcysteine oxidase [Eremomyces bilateralis CBS 781.70]
MRVPAISVAFSLLFVSIHAFSFPSFLGAQKPIKTSKRVAVIGGGAAGSSAAYHIQRFAQRAGLDVDITIFERNHYLGGRSTTVHAYDDPRFPIELGASIFVEQNQILVDACTEFNLSTSGAGDERPRDDRPTLGVWDGAKFVYTQYGTIWDLPRLLWRYGYAPIKTRKLVQKTVNRFLKMYEEPFFPWSSLSDVALLLGLTQATAATGIEFLEKNGVGGLFAKEIVQASTRVNYAQELNEIHGLETMVSMAPEGAMAVEGGNWQMFAHMAKTASSDVRLNVTVSAIERREKSGFGITSSPTISSLGDTVDSYGVKSATESFDTVILAAPYQFANVSILPAPESIPSEIPWVKLHVTLFTSPRLLHGRAFGIDSDAEVPTTILTTVPSDPSTHSKPAFFSISTLRAVNNTAFSPPRTEYMYKIFSHESVNPAFLAEIFDLPTPAAGHELSRDDISWMYRKVWHSYPYGLPRVTFEELKLDEGLWYTSGMESFISTMETNALMGKNIARLLIDEWTGSGQKKGEVEQKPLKEIL